MSIYDLFRLYNINLTKNKYVDLYEQIISSEEFNSDYTEKHHIVPKSLGGDDSSINIVTISARKHFLCHYLLCKIMPRNSQGWFSMVKAFNMMSANPNGGDRYFNSRLYEYARRNMSFVMSELQKGNNNSQYGTMWVTNHSKRLNVKITKEQLRKYLDLGFKPGRVVCWEQYDQREKIKKQADHVRDINLKIREATDRIRKQKFLSEYIENGGSMNAALKSIGCKHGAVSNYYKWAINVITRSDNENAILLYELGKKK